MSGTIPVSRVRVAVIGAGQMANRVHYPSLQAQEGVDIVGICDLSPERLNDTADKYGVEGRFSDYRKMIEQTTPNAVYAIGPPDAMYDIWQWCLVAGVDLFVEKPLGLTLHQARALAYLAEKHGNITQVGFQRRNSPLLTTLLEHCSRRGPVVHSVCRFYKADATPFLGARDHMMDDGVHAIDTLRAICGGEVVNVVSTTKRVGVPDINFISATLTFDNGSTGVLLNSWASGRRIFGVEIHSAGVAAEADLEGTGRIFEDGDTTGVEFNAQDEADSTDFFAYGGFLAKTTEFIDSVRTRSQPSSHFGDAVKTMEVAELILAQSLLTEVEAARPSF